MRGARLGGEFARSGGIGGYIFETFNDSLFIRCSFGIF